MLTIHSQPLAERMRPKKITDYLGQEHLTGPGMPINRCIETGVLPSMILWGPPGVGKTTLAFLIAHALERPFYVLSAVQSGVKDVREVIEKAKNQQFMSRPGTILFIDEIHRFNKSQQDSMLGAVEKGIITLIGATTENPSFEVISPLLSRCQVYILKPLEKHHLLLLLENALKTDTSLKNISIDIQENEALLRVSGGDARKLLNALEITVISNVSTAEVKAEEKDCLVITNQLVLDSIQQNLAMYDKNGEQHYDIISAFIKSIRGSDPNAAVYWMARMLAGGEDIKFIARRLVILAAEDIGLANPNALLLANTCFDAIHKIGMPEARIILSETVIYLATSPKSNSAYMAIDAALESVKKTGDQPVPLHIRNAPTNLMKDIGYGKDYQYAHQYDGNFKEQEYLPEAIKETTFYNPGNNPTEAKFIENLKKWWKGKYGY